MGHKATIQAPKVPSPTTTSRALSLTEPLLKNHRSHHKKRTKAGAWFRVDIQKQNTTTALNNHIKTQLFLFILSATVVNHPKNHSSVPDHNNCKSSSPLQPQTPRQQQLFITTTTTVLCYLSHTTNTVLFLTTTNAVLPHLKPPPQKLLQLLQNPVTTEVEKMTNFLDKWGHFVNEVFLKYWWLFGSMMTF